MVLALVFHRSSLDCLTPHRLAIARCCLPSTAMAHGTAPSPNQPQSVPPSGRHIYVVLSKGKDAGIYLDARPSNTALGLHADVLPLVVVTTDWQEALKVDRLNKELIDGVDDPNNLEDFQQRIRQSALVKMIFASGQGRIHALKVAEETGIYYGYDWETYIQPLTKFKGKLHKRTKTFEEALLWMVDKRSVERYTSPTSPAILPPFGSAYPPSPARTPTAALSHPPPPRIFCLLTGSSHRRSRCRASSFSDMVQA
ncbi:hypothetical protein NUW54_g10017 [Trametes sanguinea]|uniref:Uncharacterized protein n=1 Tax=Trametes sanguinea TaxID=158606 RepID=A0ACC1P269_9APHY|nr:hypothetical protein NUW54_g10017 [Trametes sanguinea]